MGYSLDTGFYKKSGKEPTQTHPLKYETEAGNSDGDETTIY